MLPTILALSLTAEGTFPEWEPVAKYFTTNPARSFVVKGDTLWLNDQVAVKQNDKGPADLQHVKFVYPDDYQALTIFTSEGLQTFPWNQSRFEYVNACYYSSQFDTTSSWLAWAWQRSKTEQSSRFKRCSALILRVPNASVAYFMWPSEGVSPTHLILPTWPTSCEGIAPLH